ncbi:MAG: hypothetical protein KKF67_01305 [Nanoarchaeota archaeon]|nr:hypothetical protein [Nanoarchaeota archaeon]
MESIIFTIIGAIGLILISIGIITKKRKNQDILYIFGGICLLVYSTFLKNTIFIILQFIFTLTAIYDLTKVKK